MLRTIALLVIVGFGTACNEVKQEWYATHIEAVSHGAVGRGVVPGCVPKESTSIKAAFDFATWEQWIRFSLPPTATRAYTARLASATSRFDTPVKRPTGIAWWPEELIGVWDVRDLTARGYAVYAWPESGATLVALRGGEVFCWAAP